MLDFPRVVNLCHLLMQTKGVHGDVVEVGVYMGHTAVLMASLTDKEMWLYDSFSGLPEPTAEDIGRRSDFQKGYLKSIPEAVETAFVNAGIKLPNIIVGDFRSCNPAYVPMHISFAHIDCDLYESTLDALHTIWPRMEPGGCIVIDDANNGDLPGVRKAVMEFLSVSPAGAMFFQRPDLKHCWIEVY